MQKRIFFVKKLFINSLAKQRQIFCDIGNSFSSQHVSINTMILCGFRTSKYKRTFCNFCYSLTLITSR